MKQLKLLGLALMAVFAFGAIAVASASATERGVLTLEGETGNVELTGSPAGTLSLAITGSEPPIKCTAVILLEVTLEGTTHANLGKKGTLHFTGCKRGEIACASVNLAGEKDPKEVILLPVETHLINLEGEKGELLPGVAELILNDKKEVGTVKINCGGVIIEVKGAALGQAFPLLKEKVTLTEDVTDIDLKFQLVKCDKTAEKVCQELLEKEPLLASVGAEFKAATQTTSLILVTASKMVLVDD